MSESAFKQLYSDMIQNGGDFSKCSNTKRAIKCYVKESFPHFLVTDNFVYVAAYFTKAAVDGFKSSHSNANITDLKSRVITIKDWSLEMTRVNSADVFTSYGGIEVRLIVKSFTLNDGSSPTLSRHPINIFRDDQIKTLVQNYHHSSVAAAVSGTKAALPDVDSKATANGGVVSFASGSAFNQWGFKDGKTAVVDIAAIFKQEKGTSHVAKSPSSQGKVRAVGGAKKGKVSSKKPKASGIGKTVSKLLKSATPGRKSVGNAKKSTAKLGKTGAMKTPGSAAKPGTAQISSQDDYNKMVSFLKKSRKGSK